MKKIALCSLLAILSPCIAIALEVGVFTDKHGLPYTRELGTLVDLDGTTREVYREIYADGRTILKDMNGGYDSGKGAIYRPGPTPEPTPGPTPGPTATSTGVNGAGVAMGALSVATGVVAMYDSVKEKDRKTTIKDVLEGAGGGAATMAGGAFILNSVPAFGQVAYGAAVAVGAVAGATGAGLKMFSETDCELDQVLTQARGFNVYQCCHTSQKLSTMSHANYWDIGAYMFCPEPGKIRQCVQVKGGQVNRDPVEGEKFGKLLWDDKWDACKEKWCSGWVKPDDGEKVQFYADYDNYCWTWECVDGKKRDGSKCVGGTTPVDSCAKYSANPEAYACCKNKNATWNEKTNKCDCKNSKAEWKWDAKTKKGICKVPGGGDEGGKDDTTPDTTPETTKQCWYSFSADVRCANGASISKASGFYVDTKAATCEEFTKLYKDDQGFMMEMAEKYCSQHPELPIIDDKAFNAAKDSINAFFNNAKSDASVWKNAEGKFNTARLASDLTAGVVLGTVGGVVSGVVIKKKQVEKGFDALHCTVGGQKVADWGDEFNIGLRK